MPKVIAAGILRFGETEVDCYVLDNGQRVLSKRGTIGVLSDAKQTTFDRVLSRIQEEYSAAKEPLQLSF